MSLYEKNTVLEHIYKLSLCIQPPKCSKYVFIDNNATCYYCVKTENIVYDFFTGLAFILELTKD